MKTDAATDFDAWLTSKDGAPPWRMPIADPTYASKVRRAREMDSEQKLLEGPRLFASACERMKDGIRHQFPDADEARVHEILVERLALLKRINEVK